MIGHDLPDAGEGMCCAGAAALGPERCTCWEPEYDQPQAAVQEGPMAARTTMCVDCAFRPGSPERAGDPAYAHSGGELEYVGADDGLFVCHQGMRRCVAMVHPSGVRVPRVEFDYAPPGSGLHAAKADGSPADVCAGFAARIRR